MCKVHALYLSESRITRITRRTRKGFLVHFKFTFTSWLDFSKTSYASISA